VVQREIRTSYPHGAREGFPDQSAEALLIHLGPSRLTAQVWAQRSARPLTQEERERFASGQGLTPLEDFDLTAADVRSIRHSTYNRRSGEIEIDAVVEDHQGRVHYVRFGGRDTSSVNKLKALLPNLSGLLTPGAHVQVSMGNQGDLVGNFIVRSQHAQGWQLFGAINEPWSGRAYRALVELTGGRRALGLVRLEGDPETNVIRRVSFRPEGSAQEHELNPLETEFVLSAYALGWGDIPTGPLLAESYTETTDLRHLFAFPFLEGQILFYEQLAGSPEKLQDAFAHRPVEFALITRQGNPIAPKDLHQLLPRYGHHRKRSAQAVKNPGDYHVAGQSIWLIFHPAVYPVNALAVSQDGQRLAIVNIQGLSGNLGANYWELFQWAKAKVATELGWEPFALFALDNGMDPTVNLLLEEGAGPVTLVRGRDVVNAALLVAPHKLGDSAVAGGKPTHSRDVRGDLTRTLDASPLGGRYRFAEGGFASIDITQRGGDKSAAMKDAWELFPQIKVVVYIGNEFFATDGRAGNDLPVLLAQPGDPEKELFVFSVDDDPEARSSEAKAQTVWIGAGPEATKALLRQLDEALRAGQDDLVVRGQGPDSHKEVRLHLRILRTEGLLLFDVDGTLLARRSDNFSNQIELHDLFRGFQGRAAGADQRAFERRTEPAELCDVRQRWADPCDGERLRPGGGQKPARGYPPGGHRGGG
jgi:hypothetical protein